MALFDKPLELIRSEDLHELIENQVREGYQVEYKQSVEFKDKQDKLDFLAGVTSFANTIGGDFIIGVRAASGIPTEIAGWEGIDVDREKQRIENLLRDQVEPRVPFRVHEVHLSNGRVALILRVPWSWAQPHMVRMDQVNRFYYRHSAGKDIMNVIQLRAAFALTTRLEEQIAAFRKERAAKIKTGADSRLTSPPGPTVLIHIVPFESLRMDFALDLEAVMKAAQGGILPLSAGSNGHIYTLEGVLCFDELPACNAYTQIFRNGIIETASRHLLTHARAGKLIPCGALPRDVMTFVGAATRFYQSVGVQPPLVAMMSILNVNGFEFATSTELGVGFYKHQVDRDDLIFPSVLIQNYETPVVENCRPIFDALFNAAGYPKWPQ